MPNDVIRPDWRGNLYPEQSQWSAKARFAAIVETATFSEADVTEYCRKKGRYLEQLTQWKQGVTGHHTGG